MTVNSIDHGSTFWRHFDGLLAAHRLVIDRPAGTVHPRYPDFVYPHDYGYLEETSAADGNGINVWVGSLPDRRLVAVICTVDVVKRDTEVKLLLGCTGPEMRRIFAVHNTTLQGGILIERPG